MPEARIIDQGVVFRNRWLYASHPHAALTREGQLLVVFNQTRRSSVIFHPPHDPEYRNMLTRSADWSKAWTTPQVVPDYAASGTECAGLTILSTGRVLLNQWRNRWYPLGLAKRGAPESVNYPEEFVTELVESAELETGKTISDRAEQAAPWARGHGTSFVHISEDGGRSFERSALVNTGQFHGGYGLRGCLELETGELLLPLNDIPEFRTIFTVRSNDLGLTWHSPMLVAWQHGRLFTEPALVQTWSGDLLCLMRDDTTRIMHSARSHDNGLSWSEPAPTGIDGYPPHLLALPDGRLLCTYGIRKPEYSVRAAVSDNEGQSWNLTDPIMIRRHLPNADLGYPSSVLMPDGSIFTVYYCQDDAGVTGIDFTIWQI